MTLLGPAARPAGRALLAILLFGGSDPIQEPPPPATVRIVLLGDTGSPGPHLTRLLHAVRDEEKDLVVALGDLTYPQAPPCPHGELSKDAKEVFDTRLGASLVDLGAPTLLLVGNHDVPPDAGDDPFACLRAYADHHEDLVFPGPSYSMDLGVAVLVALDTTALDDAQGETAREAFSVDGPWRVLLGHHVLRAFHDKGRSRRVSKWLEEQEIAPDVYANGDAHLLQFGVYGGIPAITSGASSEPRDQPDCPPDCGLGQRWGAGGRGYAVLTLGQEAMTVAFRGSAGQTLWSWMSCRAGSACPPSEATP